MTNCDTVGCNGIFSALAFFGKYEVTANGISKDIAITREKGKVEVDFQQIAYSLRYFA